MILRGLDSAILIREMGIISVPLIEMRNVNHVRGWDGNHEQTVRKAQNLLPGTIQGKPQCRHGPTI